MMLFFGQVEDLVVCKDTYGLILDANSGCNRTMNERVQRTNSANERAAVIISGKAPSVSMSPITIPSAFASSAPPTGRACESEAIHSSECMH